MRPEKEDKWPANPDQYRQHYRFTSAEYEAMIEAGILGKHHKVELIDGHVLEVEP